MFDLHVDKENSLLRISGEGDVTYDDVKTLLRSLLRYTKVDTHYRCITDFENVRSQISHKDMRRLKRLFQFKSPEFHVRHAHVTHPKDELMASIFFAIFGEDRDDIHTCIFHKRGLAEKWLGFTGGSTMQALLRDGLWN